jgi:TraM recognition site of TraD and TraG
LKPLFIGYAEDGSRLELTAEDLETHVHGVGASRTGKSKLVEWMVREMVRARQGFCLFDPHGFLYEDILRWLTYVRPNREIVLFNPSSGNRVVGFNPFRRSQGDLGTQAGRRVKATVKAWGQNDSDETPRLERVLRCLYQALMEQDHSLEVSSYFLNWQEKAIRDHLIGKVVTPMIRDEWKEISALTRLPDFLGQVESARNRLFRFLGSDQIRRIVGLNTNNLDLEEIVAEGKILLVNLQPSENIDEEQGRLLGTLLLNELWEVGMRRRRGAEGQKPTDFFIIVDEFQKFLTPDIPAMLDQAAKYGFHLFLFHQHLAQLEELDAQVYGSLTNARTKLVFGGLSRGDARRMTEEIFPGQVDLHRVKFLIEQTKFWPVYTRDEVRTTSSGEASGSGVVSGMTWDPEGHAWIPSTSDTTTSQLTKQEGVADIPMFYPVPFKEVSSIETYSLEETLWQMSDRLMEQYQRHFFIRRPGKKTVAAVTPFVRDWYVSPERLREYEEEVTAQFLTPHEVTERLTDIHRELRTAATGTPHELVSSVTDEDEDFAGPEVMFKPKKAGKKK